MIGAPLVGREKFERLKDPTERATLEKYLTPPTLSEMPFYILGRCDSAAIMAGRTVLSSSADEWRVACADAGGRAASGKIGKSGSSCNPKSWSGGIMSEDGFIPVETNAGSRND